MSSISLPG